MRLMPRKNNLVCNLFDNTRKKQFLRSSNEVDNMNTNIQKKDNDYVLDIDLSGYGEDDIKVQLKDGYLTVIAEKNTYNQETDDVGNCIRRERYCGKCSRSFYVGGIKEEDIKANFNNGILKLVFPKEVQ
ncbi:Hsp20/alpha crystallin family protein [Terrisporobacter sp.]